MAGFTTFFDLYEKLETAGVKVDKEYEEHCDKHKSLIELSDEQILAELNAIFIDITTLEEYRILIDVIASLEESLTIRVLFLIFQALIPVEERVWQSAGMCPPIRDIVMSKLDLLLDKYDVFAYELEKELVTWTKQNNYFNNPDKYAFIKERNAIYSDYIILAGRIINAFSN